MNPTRKAIILFFHLFICSAVFPQLQTVYNFQKDDSILKKTYYEQALQNKNKLISSLSSEYKKDYQEIYEARFSEVSKLLQSVRAVTDREVHNYLQSILKKITEANPELNAKEIRLLFSRDWWPNAFSMGEGTLIVNAGLMVFLDNEAELVFVICHELAHFYLDHSNKAIKKNVETYNSVAFQNELKRLSKQEYGAGQQLDELIKNLEFGNRRHSRENETEADRYAFMFMKNTGFDCNGIKTCLQLLDKVDDSLLHNSIDPELTFNFSNYPFKKKWVQKESAIFSQMSNDDSPLTKKERDSLKTHPDCAARISHLEDSILKARQGEKFIVNKTLFGQLKKDFFVELAEQQFKSNNLSRNLYYSLQMLQKGENTSYAMFAIARGLNFMYENQKNHKLGIITEKETRGYPTDYNILLRMLDRLKLEEIANINYNFCMEHKAEMSIYEGFNDEFNKAVKQKSQY
ncbi:MAG TPA: M48 family metalloprotease [Chitinophagaceae bacterium]|nr:M48 family metalloprotease [Chitinophagaceae bacterium]